MTRLATIIGLVAAACFAGGTAAVVGVTSATSPLDELRGSIFDDGIKTPAPIPVPPPDPRLAEYRREIEKLYAENAELGAKLRQQLAWSEKLKEDVDRLEWAAQTKVRVAKSASDCPPTTKLADLKGGAR